MSRHPDKTVAVPIAEIKAMVFELDRVSKILRDATELEGNPDVLACYNYASGSQALERVSSFANAVAASTLRYRSGKPFQPGELKPRSTAKHKSPEQANQVVEAVQSSKKKPPKKKT